jgi:hypothetical protein
MFLRRRLLDDDLVRDGRMTRPAGSGFPAVELEVVRLGPRVADEFLGAFDRLFAQGS